MALTKNTTKVDNIQGLEDLTLGQAPLIKALHDKAGKDIKDYINNVLTVEIENQFSTKDEITNDRKLSATGDFSGTWLGLKPTQVDPALTSKVDKYLPTWINVTYFGAKGDGASDDTLAVQAALTYLALIGGGTLFFPKGVYKVTHIDFPINSVDIHIVGELNVPRYNSADALSIILGTISTNDDYVIDIKNAKNCSFRTIGIKSPIAVTNGNAGTGYGIKGNAGNHLMVDYCNIAGFNYGIYVYGFSGSKFTGNNVSKCNVGIYDVSSGDSQYTNNYINTNYYMRAVTNDLFVETANGVGILLQSVGNCNITGGKIEWNSKGVLVVGSKGINISGVNFDYNTQCDIGVSRPFDSVTNYDAINSSATKAINIFGNRFLGSGSVGASSSNYLAGANVCIMQSSHVNISANTFSDGSNLAYDNNLGDNGFAFAPAMAFIKVCASKASVVGNSFNTHSEKPPIYVYDGTKLVSNVLFDANAGRINPITGFYSSVGTDASWVFYSEQNGKRIFKAKSNPLGYDTSVFKLTVNKYDTVKFTNDNGIEKGIVFTSGGTIGVLSACNATVDSVDKTKITIDDMSYLNLGDYVDIAGVAGTKKIIKIIQLSSDPTNKIIYVDTACDVAVTNASVSFHTPTYAAFNYPISASAIPTSGTWAKGDRIVNSNPSVGSPKAWICTVAGTPGTWTSEGNL